MYDDATLVWRNESNRNKFVKVFMHKQYCAEMIEILCMEKNFIENADMIKKSHWKHDKKTECKYD